MQVFLQILKVIVALLPLLTDILKQVEAAVPVAGAGKEKLAMVRATLEAAFASINDIQITFDQVWPTIQKTIDGMVAVFNATGVFKK